MKGFIRIAALLLCAMLFMAAACTGAEKPISTPEPTEVHTAAPSEVPTAVPTEVPTAAPSVLPTICPYVEGRLPKPPYKNPVSDLAFHSFDAEELSRAGFPELPFQELYGDDKISVIFGEVGVFLFDFEKEKITLSVDFIRLFNDYGAMQGSYSKISAWASIDGEYLMVSYQPEEYGPLIESYFIHIPSMTYIRGNYDTEYIEPYSWDTIVGREFEENGFAYDFRNAVIKNGDKVYKVFEDTSFVVNGD